MNTQTLNRPDLDQIFSETRAMGGKVPIDEIFSKTRVNKNKSGSIYNKGGAYDQFGPHTRAFNPFDSFSEGGLTSSAGKQPGSALPFVGQITGDYAGPVGGVAGAVAGEAVRQGVGKLFGVQNVPASESVRQLKKVGENAAMGEALGYGAGKIIEKGAELLGPSAERSAIRLTRNIIRPTGRLAKRGEQIAKTALDEGVLGADRSQMISKIKDKISSIDDEFNTLINNYNDNSVNAEGALNRMDALARRYRQLGKSDAAEKVLNIKNDIINGAKLRNPVYENVKSNDFVMGPASKQVNPKISESTYDEIPQSMRGKKRFDSIRTESGKFGRSEPKGEVFTPSKVVASPEDVVALNVPKSLKNKTPQRIYTAGPEEKYSIRGNVFGPEKNEIVLKGTEPREMSAREMQGWRKGQDNLLKDMKTGGGYGSETMSPEIAARQEYTGGLRRELRKNIPGLKEVGQRESKLIELARAIEGKNNVASRNNIFDLGDVYLGGAGTINKEAWALLALKKMMQNGKSGYAKALYGLPKFGENVSAILKSPAARAYFGNRYLDSADYNN